MPSHASPDLRVYLHVPTAIFRARVNMSTITYPVTALVFDGVTVGAFGDIQTDQTLLLGSASGLDDLGRVRVQNVATSTTIPVGRVSQGYEDGTLQIVDNAYITVLEDFRVWAKLPFFSTATGIDHKDSDIVVGDYSVEIPPVAIMGDAFADYIDPGANVITVEFDSSGSYAMADGASIAGRTWDVNDGTITVGTGTSTAITVTFPAGFRYVVLSVVDSNGKGHTTRRPVLAVDPAADVTIDNSKCQVTQRLTQNGQSVDIQMFANLARTSWPDGCLVMVFDGSPSASDERDNIRFVGWHQSDSWTIRATKTGLARDTVLRCVDVAGRLDTLPAFPQELVREDDPEVDEQWSLMPGLTLNKMMHYLLFWHSTALQVADFFLAATGDDYPAMSLISGGSSLYDQANSRAVSMTPDHILICGVRGQLAVIPDWMQMDVADRPAVALLITEDDYTDIGSDYTRPPRVHVLRNSAVITSTDFITVNGQPTVPIAFSIAPGDAFSQGTSEQQESEGLTQSQAQLNAVTGHRYARLNARFGTVRLKLASAALASGTLWQYEPASMQRAQLNIAAAYAAQRGLPFTSVNVMIKELSVRYVTTKNGTAIDAEMVVEFETSGLPAVTVIPEDVEPAPDYETPPPPEPWTPPLPGDEDVYYDDIQAYVLWNSLHVFRTWNLQDAPPVWELIDTGITGTIYSGQYIPVDSNSVGMWLMTSTGIWWCADIMATTPVWTCVLTIATVQAADATPAVGVVQFKTMFPYWSEPGFLCVATGPAAGSSNNESYAHAYFWHTHNYGATWTQVDANNLLRTVSGIFTHGYFHAGLYSMNISRNEPIIWCVRYTPNVSSVEVFVLKSTDLGHTWSKAAQLTDSNVSNNYNSLLNPFPDATDPSYAVANETVAGTGQVLEKSTDGWATKSTLTAPTGYTGISSLWRVNKRTFDDLHILAWWYHTAEAQMHLLESEDGGTTWSLLYDSGLGLGSVTNTPIGTPIPARHNTPNGWAPDDDQWVMILADNVGAPITNLVQLTLDNFATRLDKTGNLIAVGGAWPDGANDGFALPRLGPNA